MHDIVKSILSFMICYYYKLLIRGLINYVFNDIMHMILSYFYDIPEIIMNYIMHHIIFKLIIIKIPL